MTIYIENDGCSRRNAELSKLYQYFTVNEFNIVNHPDEAEYIFLSTCAFKKKEEDHSISRIKELMKYSAKLIIYGCLPDIAPSKFVEYSHLPHLSPKNLDEIDSYFSNIKVKYSDIKNADMSDYPVQSTPLPLAIKKIWNEFEISNSFFLKTARYAEKRMKKIFNPNKKYYYLFICRGCFGGCSYCAIQRAIGPLKSCRQEEVLTQFNIGLNAGYKDYVILGDDVGAYGLDRNSTFPDMLKRLLEESSNHYTTMSSMRNEDSKINFHIEEIHPKWLVMYEKELLNIFKLNEISSMLCPVQSGSNRILELMNRGHTCESIEAVLSHIRSINPNIRITTQIIVGFPSETDYDFNATLDFIVRNHFNGVTIFPYHEKENVLSVRISPKISDDSIEKRINKAIRYLKNNKIKAQLSCI